VRFDGVQAMDAKAATQRQQAMWDGIAPMQSKFVQVSGTVLRQPALRPCAHLWHMLVITTL